MGDKEGDHVGDQDRRELGRYLIDLIIGLDDKTQKWIEFLIGVESGVGVALGFLLRPGEGNAAQQVITRVSSSSH